MSPEDFDALFDNFHHSAFRLETLPAYAVSAENRRFQAFRAGLPRPERSVRTSPWLARIARTTAEGKEWTRVRVVDTPLTEYERYELIGYVESQAAGESIRIIERDQVGDALGIDFWLFDPETPSQCAVLMHYTDDGALDHRELITDRGEMDRRSLADTRIAAIVASKLLNEFLAVARV